MQAAQGVEDFVLCSIKSLKNIKTMKQIIYLTKKEAVKAALKLIADNPKFGISPLLSAIDDKANAEEDDNFILEVGSWSGEVPALVVEDEHGQVVAKLGYWE